MFVHYANDTLLIGDVEEPLSEFLLDEPASALDPISTAKVEETIDELKEDYTIAIVTHNLEPAARVAQFVAFLYLGELIEYGETAEVFANPKDPRTKNFITGRFG